MRPIVFAAILGFAFSVNSHAATIIHAGRLINGQSDQPQSEMTIVIEAGKIGRVERGYLEPSKDDTLIRLTEYTVLPGLMDMHTHLISQHSKDVYSEKFFLEEADYALRSTLYARLTLLAGFTTVRDLGDNGVNSVALRKAIDQKWIIGPRIITSGKSLATTGGHADPTNGQKGKFREDAGPVDGVVNGVEMPVRRSANATKREPI